MFIKSLTIEGFKSFKKKQTITFQQDGLFLVTGNNLIEPRLGANGVGKSSLFEALTWVLFGKTANNLKAGSVGNWSGGGCTVKLEFDNHVLQRTWNPNSLILDDKTVTQDQLEGITNLNFQSFIYSILIPQFSTKFVDLSPTEKMEVFSSIMDNILIKWDGFGDKTKTLRDSTEKAVLAGEKKTSNIEGQLKSLQPLLTDFNKWEEERTKRLKAIGDKINAINVNKLIGILKTLKSSNVEEKIKTKKLAKQEVQEEYFYFTDRFNRENLLLAEMISHDRVIQEGINELSILKDGEPCPLCSHIISQEHINKEMTKLSFKLQTDDIINKEDKIRLLVIKVKDIEKNIKDMETELLKLENEQINNTKEINKLETEISMVEKTIQDLKISMASIICEENPFKNLIKEGEKKKNILEKALTYNNENLDELRFALEVYKYWVKGFKEIKLMLTEEALIDLEIAINNNLQKLGLNEWSVKLSVDSETKAGLIRKGFTMLIKSPSNNGELVPFECWSGGEGQRIRIATTLGLSDFIKNRRGIQCDLLILDEPTQFLSEYGIEDLIRSLRDRVDNEKIKLFLIDHRSLETLGVFTKVINIVKTVEGSIVYG